MSHNKQNGIIVGNRCLEIIGSGHRARRSIISRRDYVRWQSDMFIRVRSTTCYSVGSDVVEEDKKNITCGKQGARKTTTTPTFFSINHGQSYNYLIISLKLHHQKDGCKIQSRPMIAHPFNFLQPHRRPGLVSRH